MTQDDRRDFTKFQVDLVYQLQDGCCYNCGNPLSKGFHRHHKDENHANNSTENLQLMCAECHRATFAEAGVKAHKDQEKRVLDKLNTLLDMAFESKMSGTVLEKTMEAMMTSLRVSRSIHMLDVGIEYPSAAITMGRRMKDQEVFADYYLQGLREGMALGFKARKDSND